jgi:hypothetical protein
LEAIGSAGNMLAPARQAVLDTSVLFKPSLRAELQRLAVQGVYYAIWSPWIIAELNRVLVWRWLTNTDGDLSAANYLRCGQSAKKMMTLLLAAFDIVNPQPPYPVAWASLTDADDHPIWAAAVEAHAQYVVSDNTHDYPPRGTDGRCQYQGIEYISGRDFLALLSADLPD